MYENTREPPPPPPPPPGCGWGGVEWGWGEWRGPRGWGGTLNFFYIRRLGPSIYSSPQKNIRNLKHPKKIFEILETQKYIPILYKDLKKSP